MASHYLATAVIILLIFRSLPKSDSILHIMFQALRNRARKAKAARKPNLADIKPGSVIENIAQTRRLAETTLGPTLMAPSSGMEEERPTNTGSGSQVFHRDLVI